MRRLRTLALAFLCAACGLSVEDQVEKLGGDAEERAQAKQELLLAKDRAVAPLLQALEAPRYAAARSELVEVLVSLMMRVDDARIVAALTRHLRSDPDSLVRARIAHRMGMYRRSEAIGALLDALDDPSGRVRYQSLQALGLLEDKLDEAQKERLRQKARTLAGDAHPGARMEAAIRVENFVDQWIKAAHQRELQAQLAEAESLYHRALAYSPQSKQGNYRLGRFYLDQGQREKGLQLLRRNGMLLDVPRLQEAPRIDGRLDEALWRRAARADSFYQFAHNHKAALPSEVKSEFYIGYTPQALYIGFYGRDEHPDSLVIKTHQPDGDLWWEDIIELYMDANFDHRSYVHLGINTAGVVADAWHPEGVRTKEDQWNADAEVAVQVGDDFWSAECAFRFGQQELPRPRRGDIWGFNFVRTFRGSEYSQWVRTYGGSAHTPDDFGLLVFN